MEIMFKIGERLWIPTKQYMCNVERFSRMNAIYDILTKTNVKLNVTAKEILARCDYNTPRRIYTLA